MDGAMYRDIPTDIYSWQASCQNYLMRLGMSEYRVGLAQHIHAGRKKSTYRHNPSEYHRDLIQALGENNEEKFKAIKALRGYAHD